MSVCVGMYAYVYEDVRVCVDVYFRYICRYEDMSALHFKCIFCIGM
jgi:hypothetical protein